MTDYFVISTERKRVERSQKKRYFDSLFYGKPGPYYNLYTVVYYIRYAMMEKRKYGYAAAAAVILFLCIFVVTLIELGLKKRMGRKGLK